MSKVSNLRLKERRRYAIVTPEVVEEIFNRRLLAADLLARVDDRETSHAAKMVRLTLEAVRAEIERMME